MLHLCFTCFQSLLLWWPFSPARHRQHLVPAEWKFNIHETQPKGTNLIKWLIFSLLLCHLCHLWSRSGFNRLSHCCVHISEQMVGWVFCWCIDAWVHHVRVSRGHLVLFSSAGGWPERLLPDDWIGLWCGFDSYSGATLSSDRPMGETVCTCGPPPHLVPPNPATHMQAPSACSLVVMCV